METQAQQLANLKELLNQHPELLDDFDFRREARKTFYGFCLIYLPHYFELEPAEFHPELIFSLEDFTIKFLEIVGYRGSAKSTYGSLAFVLYASLERPDLYPFIIPCADTGTQAALNIANIKYELDNNELLKQDYGGIKERHLKEANPDPSLESDEEWQAKNMLLSNGVRILARSRGQKVRGFRHRQHRPKLIIIDDAEDLEWVRTKENRDKTERWFRGEIIPALDETSGRCVVIGNWLHADALMARIKRDKLFKLLEYPLLKDGRITWLGKYPNQEAIEEQKLKVGPNAFMREYLLKVVAEEGAPVKEEWIHYYDVPPANIDQGLHATGVDLAISKKATADYTAMVGATSLTINGRPAIFVAPNPVNARLSFHETIETAKGIIAVRPFSLLFVESVQYQQAAIEEMEAAMLPVMAMRPTQDKRARLLTITPYLQSGIIRFPRTGCEDLLIQLLGFGVEEHDDLVDAFVYAILGLVQQGLEVQKVTDLFSAGDAEDVPRAGYRTR